MVGWVGPRTEGPFSRGFRPPGSLRGWLRRNAVNRQVELVLAGSLWKGWADVAREGAERTGARSVTQSAR